MQSRSTADAEDAFCRRLASICALSEAPRCDRGPPLEVLGASRGARCDMAPARGSHVPPAQCDTPAERGGGSVIIVSSVAALIGSAVLGTYGLSKAADVALARNLAVEWGEQNVRTNCINPAIIRTDFARALWEDPENLKRRMSTAPLRRIAEPDEMAGAAIMLASKAGSYITGQTITVDGGVCGAG